MSDGRFKDYLEERYKAFEKLARRVREEIELELRWRRSYYTTVAYKCESPIEQLIAIHLTGLENNLYRDSVVLGISFDIRFDTQREVEVDDKLYRLDFSIELKIEDKNYKFAIECDGHDYHEKTKEQARRDKQRDRDLTSKGYTVIRFTGSEIWKNPSGCVGELEEIINQTTGISEMYDLLVEKRYQEN